MLALVEKLAVQDSPVVPPVDVIPPAPAEAGEPGVPLVIVLVLPGEELPFPFAHAVHDVETGVLIVYPSDPDNSDIETRFNFDNVISWTETVVTRERARQIVSEHL